MLRSGCTDGTYRVSARVGELQSEPEWFLVSTGRENDTLRREYARYRVDRAADPQTLRDSLLELARLDPLNAGPWIRLGDLALDNGTLADARAHYGRALDVFDERRRMFTANGDAVSASMVEADRGMIAAVRELLPYYFGRRATLYLRVENVPRRRYVLTERQTGRVLRTVEAVGKPPR